MGKQKGAERFIALRCKNIMKFLDDWYTFTHI